MPPRPTREDMTPAIVAVLLDPAIGRAVGARLLNQRVARETRVMLEAMRLRQPARARQNDDSALRVREAAQ